MAGSVIDLSKYRVETAFRLREKADYQDFTIISREQAQEQLAKAEKIISVVKLYLRVKWDA